MPGERGRVGQDAPVPDGRVVPDVRIRHDQAVGPDPRDTAAARRSARDRHVLANAVAVADLQSGGLALVLQVLGRDTKTGEGPDLVLAPEGRVSVQHHVRHKLATLTQNHVRSDRAIRPNLTAVRNDRALCHDGCGVDVQARVSLPSWMTLTRQPAAWVVPCLAPPPTC